MNRKKYYFLTVYLMILFSFVGCKASVKITALQADASAGAAEAQVQVNLDLGALLGDTIVSLTGLIGDSATGSKLFNKAEMEKSLMDSGFTNVSVIPRGETGVDVKSSLKKGSYNNFINSDKQNLTVTFTQDNIGILFASLGDDYLSYASLLMAPVLSGEKMSVTEYKELLSAVYGDELAKEVTESVIDLTLQGLKGKKSSFRVNLCDILCLTDAMTYSVSNQ